MRAEDVVVLPAGTHPWRKIAGKLKANGGRVLNVTGHRVTPARMLFGFAYSCELNEDI